MGAGPGRGQGGDVTIQHLLVVDEILILGPRWQSLADLGDGRVHGAQNGFGFGRLLLTQGRGSALHCLDEVVRHLGDFERFAGFEARVETNRPVGGRRRFRGRLVGVAGQVVRIQVEGATVDLPYADIGRAKLLLTDELLAASEKRKGP